MGSIPGWGRSPEKKMATHSSILTWEISWTEEPVHEAIVHGVTASDPTYQLNKNKAPL